MPVPGCRLIGPSTGRVIFPSAAMVLLTSMLFSVMFPVLDRVPVTVRIWPGCTNPAGHALTTSMLGLLVEGQVAVAVFVRAPPQVVLARTVNVSTYGPHESSGTV